MKNFEFDIIIQLMYRHIDQSFDLTFMFNHYFHIIYI